MSSVVTSLSFQEKMFERIREQMGDLLTEEDLKKMLERAVEESFFKDRVVQDPRGYGPSSVKPAVFVELVKGALDERVKAAAEQWVKENPEVIEKAVNTALQKGFVGIVEAWIESKTSWPLQQLQTQLNEAFSRR